MKHTSLSIAASLAVACLLAASALPAQQKPTVQPGAEVQASVGPNGLSIYVDDSTKSGHLMRIRIVAPDNKVVFDDVRPADGFTWANWQQDGTYRYDGYLLDLETDKDFTVEEHNRDGNPPARVHGTFHIVDGQMAPRPNPEELGRKLSMRSKPSFGERFVGTVLTSLVPTAEAQDLTAEDISPEVTFDDTDDGTETQGDWEIFANLDVSGVGDIWRLFDRENTPGGPMIDVQSSSTAGNQNALVIAPDGAVSFSDGDFHMEGGTGNNFGIGTTSPGHEIHVVDNIVTAQFEDSTDSSSTWIEYDSPEFRIEGNGEQDIFELDATAPGQSLTIDNSGNIGMGTSTPNHDLTVDSGSSVTRVELVGSGGNSEISSQGASPGYTAIGSNDGDTLQMRIFRDAPRDSLAITGPDGNVGLGTNAPNKQLHVQGADASQLGANNVMARVENTTGTEKSRRMLELINNGSPLLVYRNTNSGETWSQNPVGGQFTITKGGTGQQEFQMDGNGNVTIQGSLTEDSRRASKNGFAPVDAKTVLAKLEQVPIEEWSYRHTPDARHMGPMAEDFHAAFGLGPEDGIAPRDLAGVALTAAKALKQENEAKGQRIAELEARMARLEARLD